MPDRAPPLDEPPPPTTGGASSPQPAPTATTPTPSALPQTPAFATPGSGGGGAPPPTATRASELEESEDILFCGWTLKKGLFFWAPRYFALTRRGLLCWCAHRRRHPAPSRALLSRQHTASHAGTREGEALKLGGSCRSPPAA